MAESVPKESPPEAEVGRGVRRNVRRRLVQSTLLPHNPQVIELEPIGDQQKDTNCSQDEKNGSEEARGSQKEKPKRRLKASPQKRASSGKKEKQPVSATPKKRKIISPVKNVDRSPLVLNLRLEAKLSAEENSRIFAGRKVHPFFSSWKSGRKSEEVSGIEVDCCLNETKKEGATLGPIHVLEETRVDEELSFDWRNWTFYGGPATSNACGSESTSSTFEGNVRPLTIDELPCFRETWSTNLAVLANEEVPGCNLSKDCGLPKHLKDLGLEEQNKFLQERLIYYYDSSGSFPADTLWTDKFRPNRSIEVCGNDEPVKYLSEWLHHWRQRDNQNRENLNGANESTFLKNSYNYHSDNSDSEYTNEGARLKNVLLVTGPVGCGKSAAVYACAKEQGFDVMEVSASECRNGALVKQRFGEVLESHWMKWSSMNHVDSPKKRKHHPALPDDTPEVATSDEVIDLIVLDEEALCAATGAAEVEKVKPLILFEDVDITFLEDRGFMAAIQQIAGTAKGPLILTTNNRNLVLPESLDRLEMCFVMPSRMELLCHVYMLCVAEKVGIQPYVVQRFIECCKGDIRKTIMQLQFWCQGNRYKKDEKAQSICCSGLLDLESGHRILPKLIPWSFPSELSELVERELSVSLSMMQEISSTLGIVEESYKEMEGPHDVDQNEQNVETKKEAMLSRNCSIHCDEGFAAQIDTTCWEFTKSPGTPVTFSRGKARKKLDIVFSSDSEDEVPLDQNIEINERIPSHITDNQSFMALSLDSEAGEEKKFFPYPDTGFRNHLNSPCRADDVSSVPESSYVPETEIDFGNEMSCRNFSALLDDETVEINTGNELTLDTCPDKPENTGKSLTRLRKLSDLPRSCDITADHWVDEEDIHHEYVQVNTHGYHVMDECSRVDFQRTCVPIYSSSCRLVPNLVEESWRKLRVAQLKKDIVMNQKDAAFSAVEIASRMTDLISEADLLLYKCREEIDDFVDPTAFISEKPELFSWCYEQWQITSTIFEHGFCSYAKDIAALGLKPYTQKGFDLAMEMLSSTRHKMAFAKLILKDVGGNQILNRRMTERMKSPDLDIPRSGARSDLSDVIKSVIPSRMYISIRGEAFHEYLSSLRKISILEAFRLSEPIDMTKKRRRGRAAQNYLSSSALMLSPEDIFMLDQCNAYSSSNSQSTHLNTT